MSQFTKNNNPNKRKYRKPCQYSKKYRDDRYIEMIKYNGKITDDTIKAYDISINP